MDELFRSAFPYQGVVLAVALLLCLAPQCGRQARGVIAALLLVMTAALAIDLMVVGHGTEQILEVPNIFGRGPEGDTHLWVVATVNAPAWQWHLAAIGFLCLPALLIWLRRNRPAAIPNPLLMGSVVFWFFLAFRLALEATAADRHICWAVGCTIAMLVVLPFFGYWSGRRGQTFGQFVIGLLLLAFLQRIPLIVFAWFATTRHWGTHLDTHVITDITLPLAGEMTLEDDLSRWVWPHLVPHITFWILITLVFGIALGAVPRWIGARSHRARQ